MDAQTQISKQQNEIAATTQRAFVTFSDLKFDPNRQPDGKITGWAVSLSIQNTGNTPAKYLHWMVSEGTDIQQREKYISLPADPPDLEPFFRARPNYMTDKILGPHMSLLTGGSGFSVDDLLGNTRMIYGIAQYKDAFPDTPVRTTEFCYMFVTRNWDGQTPPPYGPCVHWNCADETCADDRKDFYKMITDAYGKANMPIPDDLRTQ